MSTADFSISKAAERAKATAPVIAQLGHQAKREVSLDS